MCRFFCSVFNSEPLKNTLDEVDTMADITNLKDIESNQLFDLILKEVGGFGWYQKLLLVLSLFVSILAACNHLSPIYLTYTPNYKCIEGDSNQIIANTTNVS